MQQKCSGGAAGAAPAGKNLLPGMADQTDSSVCKAGKTSTLVPSQGRPNIAVRGRQFTYDELARLRPIAEQPCHPFGQAERGDEFGSFDVGSFDPNGTLVPADGEPLWGELKVVIRLAVAQH